MSDNRDANPILKLQDMIIHNNFEKFKEMIESGSIDINQKYDEMGPVNRIILNSKKVIFEFFTIKMVKF
jgi:hypothetical protein